MDNKAANDIKHVILKYKLTYQLVPPHIHQINAAERAICMFKNHFLAGLASVDPSYPINELDRLHLQAKITLNLIQASRLHPLLSVYAVLNGQCYFNPHQIVPSGKKIIVHNKPSAHESWSYHGKDGFYIGPAMEHYLYVQCLMMNTCRIKTSDTVQFFPHTIDFPNSSLNDRVITVIDEITSILASRNFHHDNPTLVYDNEKGWQQFVSMCRTSGAVGL